MDFFARQDRARRKTSLLLMYFVAAVVLILVALNLIGIELVNSASRADSSVAAEQGRQTPADRPPPPTEIRTGLWQPDVIAFISIVTLLVIGAGSLYKTIQLSGGGRSVAGLMRAVAVPPDPGDPKLQMLRNVVEEMSIASGVPVPAIYVLAKEQCINAFAAGFTPKDAVICVTQGCIDRLTREELQGVIAHEFSHIYNGDMGLDLRLVGVVHGILLLGLIGYGMIRIGGAAVGEKDSGTFGFALLIIGVIVGAIGFIGLFFGRLIQSAVCRQREFLADAAAVQFTRNPGALRSALKKLGASGAGSRVSNHSAEQIAHMFFASSMGIEWGWFATHPPLAKRIEAVDADLGGKTPAREASSAPKRDSAAVISSPAAAFPVPIAAAAIIGTVGMPMVRHIAWASDLLTSIPPAIDHAARDPFSARALVFALLLSTDPAVRERQLGIIHDQANAITRETVVKLMQPLAELGSRARRVLIDLSVPALRMQSDPQANQFRKVIKGLVDADGQISIFEFMLYKILAKHLPAPGGSAAPSNPTYFALKPVMGDIQIVLSALAEADGKDPATAGSAFRAGIARLEDAMSLQRQPAVTMVAVDAALNRLALAAPGVKRRVIDACAYCVAADEMVQTEEGELLRAITTALDSPLPPLLGGDSHASATV